MASDAEDPRGLAPRGAPWRWSLLVAGALLLAGILAVVVVLRDGDDEPAADLTFDWGGSEGRPGCAYDLETDTVDATIAITGTADPPRRVTVTVTAYSDENTSKPVGSGSRSMQVDGDMDTYVVVTLSVDKAPEVDIDGEAACSLEVSD